MSLSRSLLFLKVTLVLAFAVGCGNESTSSSGKFSPFAKRKEDLVTRLRKPALTVCMAIYSNDPTTQKRAETHTRRAVLEWLDSIRASTMHFVTSTVNFTYTCPADRGDLVISVGDDVRTPDNKDRAGEHTRSYCQIDGNSWHCRIWSGAGYMTYLHEVGHALGLADTYREGSWGAKEAQPKSVMSHPRSYSNLQSDDVAGARFIYCQAFQQDCKAESHPNLYLPNGFYATIDTYSDFSVDKYGGQAIYRVADGTSCLLNAEQAARFGAYGKVKMLYRFHIMNGTRNSVAGLCK